MTRKTQLRSIVILALLVISILMLSAAGPLAAEPAAFSLTTEVSPPGSGSVDVDPPGPYDANDVVTLTATPATGYQFDRWVLADDTKWWNAGWDYRVEVTAGAAGYARKNKPAEFALNFTQIWTSLGATGTLDPNSIRVVEVDAQENVIDEDVSFQFDRVSDFNAASKAAGTLVLIMEGNTAAGATRRYHVYFDVTGKGFTAPNVPAQLTLTDGIKDENVNSLKVELLNAPASTYFYHKPGGGISSLNDANGNDWISWNSAIGSAGQSRGIPNAGGGSYAGIFHPGPGKMTSTIRNSGPIKVTVHVIENSAPQRSKWEGMFEFYPGYVTFTMINATASSVLASPFWFLYEGTPGGLLNPTTDYIVFSNGEQINANQTRNGDLPDEEWAYVVDPNVGTGGRSIFLINHTDDDKNDTYFPSGNNLMTVLGFGRNNAQTLLPNNSTPRKYSFGLMDEILIDNVKPIVYNVYRDLNTNVGSAKARAGATLGSTNPVQFTITGDHIITAQFKPLQYTVTTGVTPSETGTVTKSPNQTLYNHGDEVTLTAAATAPGYNFAGWQGDVTGTENPVTVPVTKNMVVTALFAQKFTVTTSASPVEGGTVTVSPQQDTYDPGTQITVTASSNTDYTFTGWSGDLSGTELSKVTTVNGNLNIVGNFGLAEFTFEATSSGNGTVDWTPKKDLYAAGEEVTVTASPNSGFAFNGWTGGIIAPKELNPLVVTMDGNKSVIANFVSSQTFVVNVTVPGGGGTVTKNPPGPDYPAGATVTLTAVPDTGKRFVAWGGDASGTSLTTQITVNSDKIVTAEFADDGFPINVTIVPSGSGAVFKEPNQPFYMPGTPITLTAVAGNGWAFSSWSGDAFGQDTVTTMIMPEGEAQVTATFVSLGTFTLTVSTAGDGTGSVTRNPQKDEYVPGESVKLTAVPDGDAVFAGWSGDATGTKNPLTITMDSDKIIVANFIMPSGPFSDPFDSCGLNPRWGTPINPLGDATIGVNGTQLSIAVPEGATHNLWNNIDTAPRIMQDADNLNFEYVVKFASAVTQNAQMQGLVIEQDAQTFVRFDFEFNDSMKAFAMPFTAGNPINQKKISVDVNPAAAVYMKIARVGNNWTMSYSGNGSDWIEAGTIRNYAINVARVGIFAGNVSIKSAPAPAHTAIVDFFQNVAQGPIGEDRPLLTIITEGNGSVTTNPPLSQLACGQTVTLTAQPDNGETFTGWSGDVTGTQASVSLLLDGPKTVTAAFTASGPREFKLFLPSVIR